MHAELQRETQTRLVRSVHNAKPTTEEWGHEDQCLIFTGVKGLHVQHRSSFSSKLPSCRTTLRVAVQIRCKTKACLPASTSFLSTVGQCSVNKVEKCWHHFEDCAIRRNFQSIGLTSQKHEDDGVGKEGGRNRKRQEQKKNKTRKYEKSIPKNEAPHFTHLDRES